MNTANEPLEPNLYDLKGHGVHVSYSTTSIAGVPLLTVEDRSGTHSFRGDQIRVQDTELGRLVTVTVETVPDLRSVSFSVLLPPFHLDGTEGELHTTAIRTTARTSIAGPRLVKGQVNSYEVVDLRGTAKAVAF